MGRDEEAMELLISIAGIMDAVREAVSLLEAGQRDQGLDRLSRAINGVQAQIRTWEGSRDAPLPPRELLEELHSVLEELTAARAVLEAEPTAT
ncbi:hypothetical protein DRJ54_05330 [Candidatus Acetothermia bacterium]|nr:MAG: hypothetical protein DRJ54_05330 [Candidatus Acetothermia bacterium]